ncbi:MAG: redoxin domain-containing protein [Proteobacteria bacterium]|jgi:peroxiredoxin|nr:redoxin domain-containing protein [Pseudomonadota bacterium]
MSRARPVGIGDPAPAAEGRTDEGTPISIADFKGRALAVFLLGRELNRAARALLAQLAKRTPDFLAAECSPLAISAEPAEMLAELRDASALPFLLVSDTELGIHRALAGTVPPGPSGAWLFDRTGALIATVPALGAKEQVPAVLAALARLRGRQAP